MYEYAVELIKKGLAYVCQLTPEEMNILKYRPKKDHPKFVDDLDTTDPNAERTPKKVVRRRRPKTDTCQDTKDSTIVNQPKKRRRSSKKSSSE